MGALEIKIMTRGESKEEKVEERKGKSITPRRRRSIAREKRREMRGISKKVPGGLEIKICLGGTWSQKTRKRRPRRNFKRSVEAEPSCCEGGVEKEGKRKT